MKSKEVKRKVEQSIVELVKNDEYLLRYNCNERSITHKLAEHLQNLFQDYNVDCEFNRNYDDIKELEIPVGETSKFDTEAKTVYPDIIIHKRGTDENLVVIEVKKDSNYKNGNDYDQIKLRGYKKELHYRYAIFICLDTSYRTGKYQLYEIDDHL